MVGMGDASDVLIGQLAVGAVHHTPLLVSVYEQHFTPTVAETPITAVACQEPQTGGYLGRVEELSRQRNHTVHQVRLNQASSYLTLARLVGRHGAVGKHESGCATRGEMPEHVLHPGKLAFRLGGTPCFQRLSSVSRSPPLCQSFEASRYFANQLNPLALAVLSCPRAFAWHSRITHRSPAASLIMRGCNHMYRLLPSMGSWDFGFRLAILSLALASVIVLAACGGRGNSSETETEPAGAAPSVQAQTGPREIPVSGSLVFPNTVSLSFESPGIVGEVLVRGGDVVQSGQPLASLDRQTISRLETAVAGAQLSVTSARNSLNALRLEPNIQVANAELEVAGAEVALDEAQDTLDNLRQRPGINVAAAKLAVAQAELGLDEAQERLDDLLEPQQIAVSGAEARIAAAKVELDAAQEAYDDIKDGGFPEEVLRDARNGVSFATTALEAANRTRNDAHVAAQTALMRAEDGEYLLREQYNALFKFWFGTELTDAELEMTSDEVLEEWGIDLDATFERLNPEYASVEPTPNNPATRWNELTIWAWLNLSLDFSGIVPTCMDEDALARTERCITRELQNAYDAFDSAQDALEAARNNAATTAEQTEDAVAAAEDALSDARDALEELEEGPDASLIESAEKRLQLAEVSLQEAEDDLAELTVDIDPLNIALARAAVGQAEVAFEEANDMLERAQDDALQVEMAGKQFELASAALIVDETRLDEVRDLLNDQIAAAEAELALAQSTLEEAQESLVGAVINSPIDGTVALINVDIDDPVGDELTAISVVSTDVVEIDGVIDAAGRPYVSEGASAVVSIESIGDTQLNGSVSFIGSEARTERGVISYAVRIRVDVPSGVSVPISLSAASAVIMASDTALLHSEPYPYGDKHAPAVTARLYPIHSSRTEAH